MNRGGRHKNTRWQRTGVLGLVGEEFYRGVHVRPEIRVRIQNLHLHLHRSLGTVGLWRDFGDHAVPMTVRVGIHCDRALLFGTELREIVLRDIEFHLKIV